MAVRFLHTGFIFGIYSSQELHTNRRKNGGKIVRITDIWQKHLGSLDFFSANR